MPGATRIDVAVEQGGRRADPRRRRRLRHRGRRAAAGRGQPRHQQDSRRRRPVSRRHARLPRRGAGVDRRGQPAGAPQPAGGRRAAARSSKSSAGGAGAVAACGRAVRHDDRSPAAVLQHAGAAEVPADDADRDGPPDRGLHAAGAGPSAGPLHAARTTAGCCTTCRRPTPRERIAALFGAELADGADPGRQPRRRRAAVRATWPIPRTAGRTTACSICSSTAGSSATARCSTPWAKRIAGCCSRAAIRSAFCTSRCRRRRSM